MTRIGWQGDGDTGTVVGPQGQSLARYSFGSDRNHPHLRDVRPLNHVGVVTNHAPWDHRWHHGLWFSWKYLDDVLFWEDHPDFGGDHDGLGHSTVVATTVGDADGRVVVDQELRWVENRTGRTMLDEQRRMVIRVLDAEPEAWAIDWTHTWSGTQDVKLSATPYPQVSWGGYAGLSYRPSRSMHAGEILLGSRGRTGAAALHGEPAEWIGYFGHVDGSGTDDPEHPATGGIALFDHPENARYRASSAYATSADQEFGFLACTPLMHEPYGLTAGDTLTLRFRSVVFGTVPERDRLEDLSEEFGRE